MVYTSEENTVKHNLFHELMQKQFLLQYEKNGKISIWEVAGSEVPSEKHISHSQHLHLIDKKVASKRLHYRCNDEYAERRYMGMDQIYMHEHEYVVSANDHDQKNLNMIASQLYEPERVGKVESI